MNQTALHNESQLLRRLVEGHEASFRELYDYYAVYVYRVARHFLRSPELAEDIVQEIFLTIWSKRAQLGSIAAFRNYLFIMTRNLCLKHLKNRLFLTGLGAESSEVADSAAPEEEDLLLLAKAIESLPPQQKKVFEMAKIQGLSHEAISRELALAPSTVNNHMTAAFRAVRSYFRQGITGVTGLFAFLFP